MGIRSRRHETEHARLVKLPLPDDRALKALALVLLGALAMALASAFGAGAHTGRTTASTTPKTVFQCQKAFRGHKTKLASCIKRVKSEKPGTSCAHPLTSEENAAAEHHGDVKDFSVNVVGYNPNIPVGGQEHVRVQVTLHGSRVVLCSKVTLRDASRTNEEELHEVPGPGTLHTYSLSIAPSGGLSSQATILVGSYSAVAMARLRRP
jgi:hypothetical protein